MVPAAWGQQPACTAAVAGVGGVWRTSQPPAPSGASAPTTSFTPAAYTPGPAAPAAGAGVPQPQNPPPASYVPSPLASSAAWQSAHAPGGPSAAVPPAREPLGLTGSGARQPSVLAQRPVISGPRDAVERADRACEGPERWPGSRAHAAEHLALMMHGQRSHDACSSPMRQAALYDPRPQMWEGPSGSGTSAAWAVAERRASGSKCRVGGGAASLEGDRQGCGGRARGGRHSSSPGASSSASDEWRGASSGDRSSGRGRTKCRSQRPAGDSDVPCEEDKEREQQQMVDDEGRSDTAKLGKLQQQPWSHVPRRRRSYTVVYVQDAGPGAAAAVAAAAAATAAAGAVTAAAGALAAAGCRDRKDGAGSSRAPREGEEEPPAADAPGGAAAAAAPDSAVAAQRGEDGASNVNRALSEQNGAAADGAALEDHSVGGEEVAARAAACLELGGVQQPPGAQEERQEEVEGEGAWAPEDSRRSSAAAAVGLLPNRAPAHAAWAGKGEEAQWEDGGAFAGGEHTAAATPASPHQSNPGSRCDAHGEQGRGSPLLAAGRGGADSGIAASTTLHPTSAAVPSNAEHSPLAAAACAAWAAAPPATGSRTRPSLSTQPEAGAPGHRRLRTPLSSGRCSGQEEPALPRALRTLPAVPAIQQAAAPATGQLSPGQRAVSPSLARRGAVELSQQPPGRGCQAGHGTDDALRKRSSAPASVSPPRAQQLHAKARGSCSPSCARSPPRHAGDRSPQARQQERRRRRSSPTGSPHSEATISSRSGRSSDESCSGRSSCSNSSLSRSLSLERGRRERVHGLRAAGGDKGARHGARRAGPSQPQRRGAEPQWRGTQPSEPGVALKDRGGWECDGGQARSAGCRATQGARRTPALAPALMRLIELSQTPLQKALPHGRTGNTRTDARVGVAALPPSHYTRSPAEPGRRSLPPGTAPIPPARSTAAEPAAPARACAAPRSSPAADAHTSIGRSKPPSPVVRALYRGSVEAAGFQPLRSRLLLSDDEDPDSRSEPGAVSSRSSASTSGTSTSGVHASRLVKGAVQGCSNASGAWGVSGQGQATRNAGGGGGGSGGSGGGGRGAAAAVDASLASSDSDPWFWLLKANRLDLLVGTRGGGPLSSSSSAATSPVTRTAGRGWAVELKDSNGERDAGRGDLPRGGARRPVTPQRIYDVSASGPAWVAPRRFWRAPSPPVGRQPPLHDARGDGAEAKPQRGDGAAAYTGATHHTEHSGRAGQPHVTRHCVGSGRSPQPRSRRRERRRRRPTGQSRSRSPGAGGHSSTGSGSRRRRCNRSRSRGFGCDDEERPGPGRHERGGRAGTSPPLRGATRDRGAAPPVFHVPRDAGAGAIAGAACGSARGAVGRTAAPRKTETTPERRRRQLDSGRGAGDRAPIRHGGSGGGTHGDDPGACSRDSPRELRGLPDATPRDTSFPHGGPKAADDDVRTADRPRLLAPEHALVGRWSGAGETAGSAAAPGAEATGTSNRGSHQGTTTGAAPSPAADACACEAGGAAGDGGHMSGAAEGVSDPAVAAESSAQGSATDGVAGAGTWAPAAAASGCGVPAASAAEARAGLVKEHDRAEAEATGAAPERAAACGALAQTHTGGQVAATQRGAFVAATLSAADVVHSEPGTAPGLAQLVNSFTGTPSCVHGVRGLHTSEGAAAPALPCASASAPVHVASADTAHAATGPAAPPSGFERSNGIEQGSVSAASTASGGTSHGSGAHEPLPLLEAKAPASAANTRGSEAYPQGVPPQQTAAHDGAMAGSEGLAVAPGHTHGDTAQGQHTPVHVSGRAAPQPGAPMGTMLSSSAIADMGGTGGEADGPAGLLQVLRLAPAAAAPPLEAPVAPIQIWITGPTTFVTAPAGRLQPQPQLQGHHHPAAHIQAPQQQQPAPAEPRRAPPVPPLDLTQLNLGHGAAVGSVVRVQAGAVAAPYASTEDFPSASKPGGGGAGLRGQVPPVAWAGGSSGGGGSGTSSNSSSSGGTSGNSNAGANGSSGGGGGAYGDAAAGVAQLSAPGARQPPPPSLHAGAWERPAYGWEERGAQLAHLQDPPSTRVRPHSGKQRHEQQQRQLEQPRRRSPDRSHLQEASHVQTGPLTSAGAEWPGPSGPQARLVDMATASFSFSERPHWQSSAHGGSPAPEAHAACDHGARGSVGTSSHGGSGASILVVRGATDEGARSHREPQQRRVPRNGDAPAPQTAFTEPGGWAPAPSGAFGYLSLGGRSGLEVTVRLTGLPALHGAPPPDSGVGPALDSTGHGADTWHPPQYGVPQPRANQFQPGAEAPAEQARGAAALWGDGTRLWHADQAPAHVHAAVQHHHQQQQQRLQGKEAHVVAGGVDDTAYRAWGRPPAVGHPAPPAPLAAPREWPEWRGIGHPRQASVQAASHSEFGPVYGVAGLPPQGGAARFWSQSEAHAPLLTGPAAARGHPAPEASPPPPPPQTRPSHFADASVASETAGSHAGDGALQRGSLWSAGGERGSRSGAATHGSEGLIGGPGVPGSAGTSLGASGGGNGPRGSGTGMQGASRGDGVRVDLSHGRFLQSLRQDPVRAHAAVRRA